ncbi:hypothetical protein FRC10_005224 [Ceratobasidium sp. 414]|nr:hypothetical protein FRC10_005224 [Ceratobasidium sp. 414]
MPPRPKLVLHVELPLRRTPRAVGSQVSEASSRPSSRIHRDTGPAHDSSLSVSSTQSVAQEQPAFAFASTTNRTRAVHVTAPPAGPPFISRPTFNSSLPRPWLPRLWAFPLRPHPDLTDPGQAAHAVDKRPRVQPAPDEPHRVPVDLDVHDLVANASQVTDDASFLAPQDMGEVISAWESSVRDVRDRVIAASVQDARLGKDLDHAYLGSAYIRFVGPGSVHGVVDLELNPNKRGNPRGLNPGHVGILHDIFSRPMARKDHESPIYLAVDGDLIPAKHRAAMADADARNILSNVPPLVLQRDDADDEARLEQELWVQRVDGRWLSPDELHDRQALLDHHRSNPSRGMAYILNGNHRTRAMLAINDGIVALRDGIRARLEASDGSRADIERDLDTLRQNVEAHTWRCLVYDSTKLTKTAHNYLVHNEHERPAMGMGPGEKAWWLAQKFETEMEELMNSGGTQRCSRSHAADVVQARWRREIGSNMTMTGFDAESDEPKHLDKVKQLGDLAGADAASRLFFNPLGMELVLDCRSALWAFGELIDKPLAIKMLRPSGGPLIAHVWLSLRTLITIMNVLSGDGLIEAENWLARNEQILAGGYHQAATHYRALHCRPERVPQLLSKYGVDQAVIFGELYLATFRAQAVLGRVDYSSSATLVALRTVFDKFGRTYNARKSKLDSSERRVAASIRLYARLATYETGNQGEAFYPMAVLPCTAVRDVWVSRWHGGWKVPGTGDCLAPLEELLSRCQIVWTIGAQGAKRSCNWQNWYNRSRGLHQVVLRLLESKTLGPTEARLSEALAILEDPRLPLSLKSVEEFLQRTKPLQQLIAEFCAHKTAKFHYPGVKHLLQHSELDHGTYEAALGSLTKARSALRASAWEQADRALGTTKKARKSRALQLDQLLARHPILSLVHDKFWDTTYPAWFIGWEDAEAKRMGTAGCALGWGLLHRYLVDQQMPDLFKDKASRWLLEVASRVLRLTGQRPWWVDVFSPSDLPRIPATLPNDLHIFPKTEPRRRKTNQENEVEEPKEAEGTLTVKLDGGKGPKEQADSSSHVPNEQGKGKSTASRRKKSAQAPKSKSTIVDLDAGDGDGGAESDDGLPHPESEGKEAADEKRRMGGGEGDPSIVGGLTDVRKQSSTEGRGTAIEGPWFDENDEGRDPGANDFYLSFGERVGLKNKGTDLRLPPAGYQYYHQSSRARAPAHIFAAPIASTFLPHNAWRQLAETRDAMVAKKVDPSTLTAMDERLFTSLKYPAHCMAELLNEFADERANLRNGLISAMAMVQKLESHSDIACLLLADIEAGLKDVYVARCAKAMMLHVGMPEEEAITEVVRMATDDGLIEENLFRIAPDNWAELHLMKTFPQEMRQRHRDGTMRIMRNILPTRGLGRTQQESRERGLLGVEHAIVKRKLEQTGSQGVHGQCTTPDELIPAPEQVPVQPRLLEDHLLYDRAGLWKTVGPSLVRKTEHSPFSDGCFAGVLWMEGPWLRSDESKDARLAHRTLREAYSDIWAEATARELSAFEEVWAELHGATAMSSEGRQPPILDQLVQLSSTQESTAGPIVMSSSSLGGPTQPQPRNVYTPDSQHARSDVSFIPGNQEAAKARKMEKEAAKFAAMSCQLSNDTISSYADDVDD